jgi:hypothetical protein
MAKRIALTILDSLLILLLLVFVLREFLAIQIGTSAHLPNLGQVLGFDAAKVTFIFFSSWGILLLVRRARKRFKPAQHSPITP